jgi:hypothetical protein
MHGMACWRIGYFGLLAQQVANVFQFGEVPEDWLYFDSSRRRWFRFLSHHAPLVRPQFRIAAPAG